MEELCERLDARAAMGGTSTDAATVPEESEEVREKHRQVLAEIRSCFRLLSIHSRLSGAESPRTRRISTQTGSCESLHSLAGDAGAPGNRPLGALRGLSPTEDAQNSLLYNQLIIGSTSSVSDDAAGSSTAGTTAAATETDPGPLGGEEALPESIHQRPVVNPTSRLKTVVDLSKSDVIKVVEWLYRDHPGAVWRAASREAMGDRDNSRYLIYGEVSFVAFAKLLEQYAPRRIENGSPLSASKEEEKKKGKMPETSSESEDLVPSGFNFYDLGCGAGRPVYMAALLNTNCAKSCGIEIVPNMHEMNKVLLRLYNLEAMDCFLSSFREYMKGYRGSSHKRDRLNCLLLRLSGTKEDRKWSREFAFGTPSKFYGIPKQGSLEKLVQPNLHPMKQSQQLGFLVGDFLQINWSDGDIIFTNATCFGDPLFRKFEERAAKVLKPGAIVISVTRPFHDLGPWLLLERQERQMSWAPALVYVYQKKGSTSHQKAIALSTASGSSDAVPPEQSCLSPEPIAQPAEACEKVNQAAVPVPSEFVPSADSSRQSI